MQMEPEQTDEMEEQQPCKRFALETEQGLVVYKVPPKTSQYRGVSKSGSIWQARYTSHGLTHQIGRFDTEEEAHQAYEQFVVMNDKLEKIGKFAEVLIRYVGTSEHINAETKVKLLLYLFEMKMNPRMDNTLRIVHLAFEKGHHFPEFHKIVQLLVD